jgi:hypothetical protein
MCGTADGKELRDALDNGQKDNLIQEHKASFSHKPGLKQDV